MKHSFAMCMHIAHPRGLGGPATKKTLNPLRLFPRLSLVHRLTPAFLYYRYITNHRDRHDGRHDRDITE